MVYSMQIRDLDLKLLVYLRVLLEEESVSRAARRLDLSPSAMSHALKRIRQLFGDPVLVSGEGGLRRTPRMDDIFDKLQRLSVLTSEILRPPGDLSVEDIESPLVLLAGEDFHRVYGPQILAGLRARGYQGILHQRRCKRTRLSLRLEASPLAFAVIPTVLAPERLHQMELMTQLFGCVARKGHPIFDTAMGMDDYLAFGHVVVRPFDWDAPSTVDFHLNLQQRTRRIEVETPSFAAATEIVRQSDCLLTLPTDLASRLSSVGDLQAFDCPLDLPPLGFSLVWHERYALDARSQTIREAIVDIVAPPPAAL